jgi:hypothetical protein
MSADESQSSTTTPSSAYPADPALPGWRKQASILTERYLDVTMGDLQTALLLIAQAPAIAGLCVIVWSGIEQDTKSLHFVLALSAVWCGCINACREIVKERAIFERERLFGLSPLAYVLSKARILIGLDAIQVAFLLGIVEWQIGLKGALGWQIVSLLLCAAAGTGLGLAVSAFSQRQERAVAAVPLLIIPQILFSEFVIPRQYFGQTAEIIEQMMIVRWGYRIFGEAAAAQPSYWWIAGSIGILIAMTMALHLLATAALALSSSERYL